MGREEAVRQREGHEGKGRVLGRWEQKDKALRGMGAGNGRRYNRGWGRGKALHQLKALILLT